MTHQDFQKLYFHVYGKEMDYFIDRQKIRFFSYTKLMGLIGSSVDKLDILSFYPSYKMYSDSEEIYISELDTKYLLTRQTSKLLVSPKYREKILDAFNMYGLLAEDLNKVYELSRQSYINYSFLDDERSKLKCAYYAEEMYKSNPKDNTQEIMIPDVPVTLSDHLCIIAHDKALRETAAGTVFTINGLKFTITEEDEEQHA